MKCYYTILPVRLIVLLGCFLILPSISYSQKTWDGGGAADNWGDPLNWSPDGVPGAADNVTFNNSAGDVLVDVDGNYSCNNLSITSNDDVVVKISSSSYSLTINGALTIDCASASGKNGAIDAGPGTISVTGAVTLGVQNGTQNSVRLSTGTITFASTVTLNNDLDNDITFSGAGTINFNGGFTNGRGATEFITFAGCTVNLAGNYVQQSNAMVWDPTSTVVFTGGAPNITPTTAITFGNLKINSGITVTLGGSITVAGDWTNNGGTLSGGANTVTFSGTANSIGGSGSTSFPATVIASSAVYTMNNSNTLASLTFTASAAASSLSLGGTNPTLTITGAVTINQPTASFITALNINGGVCTIGGTLAFVGGNTTAGRIGKVSISSGSLTANGAVNFASNTVDANQVITVTGAGSATFASSVVTTAQASLQDGTLSTTGNGSMTFSNKLTMTGGTVSVSSTGTITFSAADAFSYNTGSVPTFTTASGSTLNFNGHLTTASALTLAPLSNTIFTGSATITPVSLIFGNLQINAGKTVTLAGNIALTNNWTNLGGTLTGNFTVSFTGTGAQTITKAGTETFYNFTSNTSGPISLAAGTNVIVSNLLTMTNGLIDLAGQTFTLGSAGVASTLTRTASTTTNWFYGGTFKRFWLSATAITSTSGNYYGLFPMGTVFALTYRPVEINTTVSPTTGGDFSVYVVENFLTTALTPVCNDAGTDILRISNAQFVTAVNGVVGGTYNIDVTMADLAPGTLSDIRLAVFAGGTTAAVVGTHAASTGTAPNPTAKRTGLTVANLSNDFRIATTNVSATPLRDIFYSIATGNWNVPGVWSRSSGGADCSCVPTTSGYAVIESGFVVTTTTPETVDFIDVKTGSALNDPFGITVGKHAFVSGSGVFSNTAGTVTIGRNLLITGTGSSSATTLNVGGVVSIGAGSTLNTNTSATFSSDLTLDGTLSIGATNLTLNGAAESISGTGDLTGSGTINVTNSKSILVGTDLNIAPVFAITGGSTVTNNGTITLTNNLTGGVAGDTWTNAASSTLNITGSLLTTGTLNAIAGANTVNYNGAGAQTIKTPAASYVNLKCSNAGTKSMAASLTVTSDVTIQDAAVLDEAVDVYDLSGGAGLTMSGTGKLIVRNTSNNLTKPDLSGAYSLAAGTTVTITSNHGGGANYCAVRGATYGTLELNGSNKYNMVAVSSILGDLSVAGTVYFNDNTVLTVSGATIYSSSVTSTLNNNLTTGSFTLTAGTVNDGGNTIEVTGSGWTKSGGTFTATGTALFSGAAAQTISGASATTFNNLTIANTSATGVTLAQPVTVLGTGVLTLTDGFLYTDAVNVLTMNSGSSVSGVSNASFVYGPMKKIGSTDFTFPVGKFQKYRPISVSSLSGSETFTSEYFLSDPNPTYDVTSKDVILDHLSRSEYWALTRAGAVNALVTLSWDSYSGGVDDIANLTVARWDGAVWRNHGNGGTTGAADPATGTVVSSALVTSFSPFTLASLNTNNPLPVELLSFDAQPNGNVVDVTWSTASEFNSDYFVVQRSLDGEFFEDVMEVNAAGNSSTVKNYSSIDPEPYPGISYYRLKQVDLDGQFAYSGVIAVKFQSEEELMVYPNPSFGEFSVELNSQVGDKVFIAVRDVLGKEVYLKVQTITQESETIVVGLPEKIAAGIYTVTVNCSGNSLVKKIAIE